MARFNDILILYNPNSTGESEANARTFYKKLQKALPASTSITLQPTEHADHAEILAAEFAQKTKQGLLVSSSGDGGYHDCINGALSSGSPANVTFGLLPSGNANDHFHAVHEPKVIERIQSNESTPVDVLRVTMHCGTKKQIHYAHSYAGIGLTPHVGKELNKRKLNRLNEVWLVIRELWLHHSVKVVVGGKRRRYESLVFSNIPRMSKVLSLSKESSIHDGLFEINGVVQSSLFGLLRHLIRASTVGLDEEQQAASYSFVCRQRLDMQIDGEIYDCKKGTTVTIEGEKDALRTII